MSVIKNCSYRQRKISRNRNEGEFLDVEDFAFLRTTLPEMSVSWPAEKFVKTMPEELKATEKFSVVSYCSHYTKAHYTTENCGTTNFRYVSKHKNS